jgi:hypothetical protein
MRDRFEALCEKDNIDLEAMFELLHAKLSGVERAERGDFEGMTVPDELGEIKASDVTPVHMIRPMITDLKPMFSSKLPGFMPEGYFGTLDRLSIGDIKLRLRALQARVAVSWALVKVIRNLVSGPDTEVGPDERHYKAMQWCHDAVALAPFMGSCKEVLNEFVGFAKEHVNNMDTRFKVASLKGFLWQVLLIPAGYNAEDAGRVREVFHHQSAGGEAMLPVLAAGASAGFAAGAGSARGADTEMADAEFRMLAEATGTTMADLKAAAASARFEAAHLPDALDAMVARGFLYSDSESCSGSDEPGNEPPSQSAPDRVADFSFIERMLADYKDEKYIDLALKIKKCCLDTSNFAVDFKDFLVTHEESVSMMHGIMMSFGPESNKADIGSVLSGPLFAGFFDGLTSLSALNPDHPASQDAGIKVLPSFSITVHGGVHKPLGLKTVCTLRYPYAESMSAKHMCGLLKAHFQSNEYLKTIQVNCIKEGESGGDSVIELKVAGVSQDTLRMMQTNVCLTCQGLSGEWQMPDGYELIYAKAQDAMQLRP